jgi:hypothetical protein
MASGRQQERGHGGDGGGGAASGAKRAAEWAPAAPAPLLRIKREPGLPPEDGDGGGPRSPALFRPGAPGQAPAPADGAAAAPPAGSGGGGDGGGGAASSGAGRAADPAPDAAAAGSSDDWGAPIETAATAGGQRIVNLRPRLPVGARAARPPAPAPPCLQPARGGTPRAPAVAPARTQTAAAAPRPTPSPRPQPCARGSRATQARRGARC